MNNKKNIKPSRVFFPIIALLTSALWVQPAFSQLSGAIWTTLEDSSEVNFNIYDAKEDVYLNGGPGKGAGSASPGLPDGIYVFMVTDPSGKTLLSSDNAECRQVVVSGGVIFGALPLSFPDSPCPHLNGDVKPGGTPVQLFPYDDTPNNGGEYKTWLTPVAYYTCPLNVVDCDLDTHGFVPRHSKTDNFKVGGCADEIDARFYDESGYIMDGLCLDWNDTHGAHNKKCSYYAPEVQVNHEAHVEAPEVGGTHTFTILNQPGCQVDTVEVAGKSTRVNGPQSVEVRVTKGKKHCGYTTFIDVHCITHTHPHQ